MKGLSLFHGSGMEGSHFLSKMVYKKGNCLDTWTELPRLKSFVTPSPPPPGMLLSSEKLKPFSNVYANGSHFRLAQIMYLETYIENLVFWSKIGCGSPDAGE